MKDKYTRIFESMLEESKVTKNLSKDSKKEIVSLEKDYIVLQKQFVKKATPVIKKIIKNIKSAITSDDTNENNRLLPDAAFDIEEILRDLHLEIKSGGDIKNELLRIKDALREL